MTPNLAENETWAEWWPDLYSSAERPLEYPGGSVSYRLAGEFLAGDDLVEEWGCATTFGRQFISAPYRGVDGGPSKFVDEVVDLRTYRSKVPKALIRHVLEHNWEWRDILRNFLRSFQQSAVVILFIPLGEHDINRSFENRVGVKETPPGLQMDEESFMATLKMPGIKIVQDFELSNDTPPFGYERLFLLEKTTAVTSSSPLPQCPTCFRAAATQMRVDVEMLGQRYEIAYNTCQVCAKEKLDKLYALTSVPKVTVD